MDKKNRAMDYLGVMVLLGVTALQGSSRFEQIKEEYEKADAERDIHNLDPNDTALEKIAMVFDDFVKIAEGVYEDARTLRKAQEMLNT